MRDLARILGIQPHSVRIIAPFIGGSFGGKGSVLPDTVAAALAARVVRRPVKVALTRPLMANNTTRRAATSSASASAPIRTAPSPPSATRAGPATCQLVQCLQTGAEKFGWARRQARPGQVREGE